MTAEQKSVSEHKEFIAQGIHVVAKPIGPVCNLNCEYCFYLEKQALFSPGEQYRMSDDVLSAFIINCGATLSLRRIQDIFFHIRKYLHAMTQLLGNGLPASYIMDAVKGPLVIKLNEE